MIKWLGSPDALLDVCLGSYVVRMLGYSALPYMLSPWWVGEAAGSRAGRGGGGGSAAHFAALHAAPLVGEG